MDLQDTNARDEVNRGTIPSGQQSQSSSQAIENVQNTESEIQSEPQRQVHEMMNNLHLPASTTYRSEDVNNKKASTKPKGYEGKKLLDFDFLQNEDDYEINLDGHLYEGGNMFNESEDRQQQQQQQFMTESKMQSFLRSIQERLITQEDNYTKWKKQSKKNAGLKYQGVFVDAVNEDKLDNLKLSWISPSFDSSEQFNFEFVNPKEWSSPNRLSDFTSDGLSLVNRMGQFNAVLNQRTMATIISMQFRLRGNSEFNLLLRATESCKNEEACLLRFLKEGYVFDMRMFVFIGRYDQEQGEYVNFKKCEVPLVKVSDEQAMGDYLDVNCKVVDLGTDEISLKAYVNDCISDPFRIVYKQCAMPMFDDFSLSVVGTGEDLAISRMRIDQIDRLDYLRGKDNNCYNSAVCHCNILQANFIG